MKTLKFLLAITIACSTYSMCYGGSSLVNVPDNNIPKVFLVQITPIEALKAYIKIDDGYAQITIDQKGAEDLGVSAKEFEKFCATFESANASVREAKERNPEIMINWALDEIDLDETDISNEPTYNIESIGILKERIKEMEKLMEEKAQ